MAWVLHQAKGQCESCLAPAPFLREDGSAYLEVHHVQRLIDGGADTVENAIAVCPNCHRQLHYGADKKALAEAIRQRIERLGK
ncbi:HNH endonuclease [Isoalcanivorax beigongshangi]|uniref:HNH endonuclease n=1 Tax=Isoalcanivorax beigongshangi TaxID=3238810 RepID=A0ABV4ADR3_9GAMM